MTLTEIFGTVEDFKAVSHGRTHWKTSQFGYNKSLVITSVGYNPLSNPRNIARLVIPLTKPRMAGFPGRRREVAPSIAAQIEWFLKEHFPDATPGEWV